MPESNQQLLSSKSERKALLIVDDSIENLTLLSNLLLSDYRVRAANNGQRALEIASTMPRPDLILLDVLMPEMDGYQVINKLKANAETQNIPVIFVTAMSASLDEERGLALGAVDYINKPFSISIVKARIRAQIELKIARDLLSNQNLWLEKEVARRISESQRIRDVSLRALACIAEVRDKETGLHILRTQSYVEILGRQLLQNPSFKSLLNNGQLEEIIRAAPLHDIGKIGIPDSILLKPGELTDEEFEVMKTHSAIGGEAIQTAIEQVIAASDEEIFPKAFNFLKVASDIAYFHHEKWDGSGYPSGLKGDDIPLSARLMALADVFDALSCSRVYKAPYSIEETIDIILEGRGSHFDPDIVDAFVLCREEFIRVAKNMADQQAQSVPALIQAPFKHIFNVNDLGQHINNFPLPSNTTILLVEANQINQEVTLALLNLLDVHVDLAENGVEALQTLKKYSYDLVLMSIQMPIMDGLTATQQIRKQHHLKHLPIIAMTTSVLASDRDACFEAGMNDHIAGPIEPEQLHKKLTKWLIPETCSTEEKVFLTVREQQKMPSIEGLNTEFGLRLVMNNSDLYIALIKAFVDNHQYFSSELETALKETDADPALRLVHILKGNVAQLGAMELAKNAQSYELDLKSAKVKTISLPTPDSKFLYDISKLIAELTLFLKQLPDMSYAEIATFTIKFQSDQKLYKTLKALLASDDVEATKLLRQESAYFSALLGSKFPALQKKVKSFEFTYALALLEVCE